MINDPHEKEMMRNQMLAIILMMGLVWAWFTFFAPNQPPVVEEGTPVSGSEPVLPTTQELAGQALRARVPSDFVEGAGTNGLACLRCRSRRIRWTTKC